MFPNFDYWWSLKRPIQPHVDRSFHQTLVVQTCSKLKITIETKKQTKKTRKNFNTIIRS